VIRITGGPEPDSAGCFRGCFPDIVAIVSYESEMKGSHRLHKKVPLTLFAVLVAVSVIALRPYVRAKRSEHWPTAAGMISANWLKVLVGGTGGSSTTRKSHSVIESGALIIEAAGFRLVSTAISPNAKPRTFLTGIRWAAPSKSTMIRRTHRLESCNRDGMTRCSSYTKWISGLSEYSAFCSWRPGFGMTTKKTWWDFRRRRSIADSQLHLRLDFR